MSGLEKLIETARGKRKAEIVIKNSNIINVLSEEIHKGDISNCDGVIDGIGEKYEGYKEIDS